MDLRSSTITIIYHYVTAKRLVQVGRVVVLNHGSNTGRIAVIVDILDHNRALIDGPTTGVHRQIISFSHVTLTDIVMNKLPRTIGTTALKRAIKAQHIDEAWNKTAWAQKLAVRNIRGGLSDFDRFKVMRLKKQQRVIVQAQINTLKKSSA
ncbi:hypothetical protein BB559_005703 [Furculomyces boomerangus]|uniref:Large ribosomal subunit protein eL14 domain-containing protein n=1 Tax=Furculomyces boomerangus TaxID=61424 RepID=A0A2T9Y788_9FUNG|nr:hypothetical protein BB559_005703 [Furculomyces boomerangus]